MLGQALGPFRLEAVLGEGGMGVVYRAVREPTGETVAIKVLKQDLSSDSVYRQRFEREARVAREVQHRHLVPVLEMGEDDGVHYLAMAFVEGASLDERIEAQGPAASARVRADRRRARLGIGRPAWRRPRAQGRQAGQCHARQTGHRGVDRLRPRAQRGVYRLDQARPGDGDTRLPRARAHLQWLGGPGERYLCTRLPGVCVRDGSTALRRSHHVRSRGCACRRAAFRPHVVAP